MKIQIANYDPSKRGGGWTFLDNFTKHFEHDPNSDIFFIAGPTLASHDEVEEAKRAGKKIVLRIDNAVRNSRNRGTGMTRMKAFCDVADLIIYQSQWAKDFLMPFTQKDGAVILNGVDTKKYSPENKRVNNPHSFLYARSSRDEGKQWINAWYWYVEQYAENNLSTLEIAGKFSRENMEYNFDFYNDEKYTFVGEQPNLVDSFNRNTYFLYSYTNDACSNTLLEAKASGCIIVDVFGALGTGGAPEIMACEDISVERMVNEYREAINGIVL